MSRFSHVFPITRDDVQLELVAEDGEYITVRMLQFDAGDLVDVKEQRLFVPATIRAAELSGAIEKNLDRFETPQCVMPAELVTIYPDFEPLSPELRLEDFGVALVEQASRGEYEIEERCHNMTHWPQTARDAFYLTFAPTIVEEGLQAWFMGASFDDVDGIARALAEASCQDAEGAFRELISMNVDTDAEFLWEMPDDWLFTAGCKPTADWLTIEARFRAALVDELPDKTAAYLAKHRAELTRLN